MIFIIVVVITIVSLIGCVCIKKPAVRIGLGIIVALGLMFTVLIGSFTYTTRYRVNSVDSSISQDGKYELLFQQIGDPDWPFGFTHARLVLKDELGTIAKYSFDVGNDGASVHSDSWQVTWKEDSVEAVISGEEQNDEQYILYFDGKTDSNQLETKYGKTDEERRKENLQRLEESRQQQGDETKPGVDSQTTDDPVLDNCDEEQTDEDGYPLSEEYQAYKSELLRIAGEIAQNTDAEIKFYLSAKGCPYAVILSETEVTSGERIEQHLIFNEAYDDLRNEYVLEEYHYGTDGAQLSSPVILDFYLIDRQSLEVTDEQINTWH